MKKTIALLLTVFSLSFALAQDQKTAPGSNQAAAPRGTKPEMMASRHSKHLQKVLALSEEQTQKTYEAMLTRFNEVHAAREKAGPNADRKALREQTKPARQKFVQTMNSILTPEQKTKWEQHRKQMKKNSAANAPKPAKDTDLKKLNDDEDGITE